MGCNCGKAAKKNTVWDYTFQAKGINKTYKTEVEARAAVIRNGGGIINARTVK